MKHTFWSGFLLTAVCALAQPALAESTYRLTRIDGDPTTPNTTSIDDLNDRGEVVGLVSFNGGETNRPLLWRDGVNTDIGDLQGGMSPLTESTGINNRGEIVGISLTTGGFRPFIYSRGDIRELPGFADFPNVFPKDINLRRQVIGNAYTPTDEQFDFLFDGSRLIRLPPLPGLEIALAQSLNELGLVAGISFKQDPETRVTTSRAVLWLGARPFDLGVLPGGNESGASDINDLSDVVGTSTIASGLRRAFLWRLGKLKELAGLSLEGDYDTVASGINNRRQIVGSQTSLSARVALLWESDGTVFDLTQLISSDDPLKPFVTLTDARFINNRGEIVAFGRDSRTQNFGGAYFLTPTP